MNHLLQDIKLGFRSLRQYRGSSFVIIATLAIAISTVTTSFSLANGVLLRALPWKDADRIVALYAQGPDYAAFNLMPIDAVRELQKSAHSFEEISAFQEGLWTVSDPGEPGAVGRTSLDSAAFRMIGAHPQKGRLFTSEEYRTRAPVAIISDQLWKTRFAGRDDILGHTIRANGASRTIVGVMPPSFGFYVRSHLWVPLDYRGVDTVAALEERRVQVLAKLRADVSRSEAQKEVELIGQRLATSDARFKRWSLNMRADAVDRQTGGWMMFSSFLVVITLLLLLLPCANIASVMLARANDRRGETLMRIALGASRWRLIQRALIEAFILAGIASMIALFLTIWTLPLIDHAIRSPGMPVWIDFGIDWRVLLFSVATAAFTALGFGLMPALASAKIDLASGLKSGRPGNLGGRAIGAGRRIIVAELAVTFVFLIGSGLMLRSWHALSDVKPGFDADRVVLMRVSGSLPRYQQPWQREELIEQIGERLSSNRRFESVARRGFYTLLEPHSRATTFPPENGLYLPDDPGVSRSQGLRPFLNQYVITDNYFRTMGIGIHEGRSFDERDSPSAMPAAVVSAALAGALWPGQSAVGRTLRIGAKEKNFTVIGVATDTRVVSGGKTGFNADPSNDIFLSERQAGSAGSELLLRPVGDTKSIGPVIVGIARSVEPELIAPSVRTLAEEQHTTWLGLEIFGSMLGGIAIIALILSVIGISGVISYQVTQRTQEIGVRMALGGNQNTVVWMMTRQGLRLTILGVSIGSVLAALATRLIRIVIFGVSVVDPLTYAVVGTAFAAVALLACYLPARRAARVDPMVALRAE